MKRLLLLFAICISFTALGQKPLQLRNLWAHPQVHVLFEGYTISFTIKDMNRALQLLSENGYTSYGSTSGLDTNIEHHLELFPGYRHEYRNKLQPIVQLGIGAFLLTKGRAVVENPKHKKLKNIIVDIQPLEEGQYIMDVKFYDPANDKLLFNGRMPASMRNADLGIDYW